MLRGVRQNGKTGGSASWPATVGPPGRGAPHAAHRREVCAGRTAGAGPRDEMMLRLLVFSLVSVFFLRLSWRSLHNPKSHGFYRFFVFEGILILFLLNAPFWFRAPLSLPQLASLTLLFASLYFVAKGVSLLKQRGGYRRRQTNPENLPFENTAQLVTVGIYRYIRHPMYSSLLLLAWGIFLKRVTPLSWAMVAVTTVLVVVAALVEEKENIAFFGEPYRRYMKRTKRFMPFIL